MAFGALRGTLQGSGLNIAASNAATGSVAVSVGDLIFVSPTEAGTVSASAVTDNLGGTYTQIVTRAWYRRVTVAGTLTSVTVTATASANDFAIAVGVFEGPFLTSPLDAQPAGFGDTTSPFDCPATGTLAQASEFVISILALVRSQSDVAATSPNLLAVNAQSAADNIAASCSVALGYQVVGSTASVTPQFTITTGTITSGIVGTFSFKADTASGINGNLGLTEVGDTIVAVGGPRTGGTLGLTEPADTIIAAGGPSVIGTLGVTEAADTIAAAGSVGFPTITGTLSVIEAADTIVATAGPIAVGTLSITEAADTIIAGGAPRVGGTLGITEAADTITATGSVLSGIGGALTLTQAAQTLVAAGNVPFVVTGTLATTQASQTLIATAGSIARGTLSVTEQSDTISASGIVLPIIVGTLSVTEQSDTISATGTSELLPVLGTLEITQDDNIFVANGNVFWINAQPGPIPDGGRVIVVDDIRRVASGTTPRIVTTGQSSRLAVGGANTRLVVAPPLRRAA